MVTWQQQKAGGDNAILDWTRTLREQPGLHSCKAALGPKGAQCVVILLLFCSEQTAAQGCGCSACF